MVFCMMSFTSDRGSCVASLMDVEVSVEFTNFSPSGKTDDGCSREFDRIWRETVVAGSVRGMAPRIGAEEVVVEPL